MTLKSKLKICLAIVTNLKYNYLITTQQNQLKIISNLSTMADKSRYFPNPKPDYDPQFGPPNIPERQIKISIDSLVAGIEKNFAPTEKNASDGVYLGCAGIAYMYYQLSKTPSFSPNKQLNLDKALQYLQPAITVSKLAAKNPRDVSSLILGPAGVYAVAAALYHTIGDETQSKLYRELYYQAAKQCSEPNFLSFGSDEFFVGRAGYIMGALWMAKETNTPLQKNDLYHLCKTILKSGRDYAARHQCQCPLMYSYYQVEYLGAAHGLCSILQSILSVPGYLQENPSDQADVKQSIDYVLSLQTSEGNFPAATDEIGSNLKLVHWCHGAGGVFYLMAKAYLIFQEDKYLKSCRLMSELIWQKGLLKKGPGICHGVAGNGYVFLVMYRLTSEAAYLHRALCFYEFLESESFQAHAKTPDCPYSLYEGIAGTVCYLADLCRPEVAAFPFSDVFPLGL